MIVMGYLQCAYSAKTRVALGVYCLFETNEH